MTVNLADETLLGPQIDAMIRIGYPCALLDSDEAKDIGGSARDDH